MNTIDYQKIFIKYQKLWNANLQQETVFLQKECEMKLSMKGAEAALFFGLKLKAI